MKARNGLILTALLLTTAAAGTASAHGEHSPRHVTDRLYGHVHWNAPARTAHLPRWLRHDKHFLRWYRQSALRHNPYLPWWKVYRVYERQYALRYPHYERRDPRYGRDRRPHGDRYDRDRRPHHDRYADDRDDRDDDRPRRRKRS